MRRREFITMVAAAAGVAKPGDSLGQSFGSPVTIGWLNTSSRESSGQFLVDFKEGMAALGWIEGSHFRLEERWANGDYANLKSVADSLVAKAPKIIVAGPLQAVVAAAKAAPATPIVQGDGGDLVAAGLATSLARPGGMVTGLTNIAGDVVEKHLELLMDTAPGLKRIGVLGDPGNLNLPLLMNGVRRSIARFSVEASFAEATLAAEIEPAIAGLAKQGAQALVLLNSALFRVERGKIAQLVLAQGWPSITEEKLFADAGLLMSYGHDENVNYRRAAYFVDRILKGTSPGYLPIEQPTKVNLVVNMKAAKLLELKVPDSILVRADEVIE